METKKNAQSQSEISNGCGSINKDVVKPVNDEWPHAFNNDDFPHDPVWNAANVDKFISNEIGDLEFEIFDFTGSNLELVHRMDTLYKVMELYYRIKILKKTLDKDIFSDK